MAQLIIKPTQKQHLAYQALDTPGVEEVFFGGGAGGGKIVSNDACVLTPFGFKKGNALEVGDFINNPDGTIQRIIQIKPEVHLPLWRVRFSDGTHTDVAEDHLWLAWKGRKSRKILNKNVGGIDSAEVIETKEVMSWIKRGYKPQIPVCKEQPFNRTTNEHDRLDPYLLGVLLGDGCMTTNQITIACAESDKTHYRQFFSGDDCNYNKHASISFRGEMRLHIERKLRMYGLLGTRSHTKFVPDSYKLGSIEIRRAVIQGLMDTDGYSPKAKLSTYYSSTSERLAKDMAFMLRSLGAVVTTTTDIGSYKKDGIKIVCKKVWNLHIKHPSPYTLFRMQRKQIGVPSKEISKAIVSVEETPETVHGRCITVSNPNGLYITDDFIVTHNSWSICESRLMRAYLYPGYKSFIGRNELKRLMQSTYLTFAKVCAFHKVPKSDWKLNGQYNYIEFKNKSRIDLLDLKYMPSEDPLYERFGSLEYSDGAIEEAGEVHPLAREVLKTRVNRHLNDELGINPCLLETGNPKKNWTYHVFYKPAKEGKLPKNLRFIQSLYRDNPYTAKSYEQTLSGIKDPVMRARLRDGEWEYEDDPAALMDYEAIADLFTNALPDTGIAEKYATLDVARYGKDKTVAIIWRGWEAYKIRSREQQGIDQTAVWFKELLREEQVPYSHAIADEDGIGGGVVDLCRGIQGFMANSTPVEERNSDERARRSPDAPDVKRAFANLKTQCAYEFAERVNRRAVSIHVRREKTREIITEDLEQVKEANIDDDAKKRSLVSKDEVKEVLGRSPDYGDALIMRAYFALERPKGNMVKVRHPAWKGYNRR